jgi:hypothetical protein
MNAPAGQVWAWGAVALLCSAALLWVNPWRGSFRDGVLVLGRQLWLLVVPAAISVGDLLRGGGYFPAFGWGRPLQGAVELGARTLGWLVLSDVPGLVLAACLAFGLPGWREGWRSGLDGYVPAVRRLADGLVAVGSAALIWLWWVGTGAGMPGRVVAVLAVPLVALGMVVMAERWRMGLASPTPVGWADGWRQSVFLGLRDGVRLLVAAVVTGLAVCLPMPWPLLVLGIGAAALAAGRWREHGAGGIAAWAAWVCVGAAWGRRGCCPSRCCWRWGVRACRPSFPWW